MAPSRTILALIALVVGILGIANAVVGDCLFPE